MNLTDCLESLQGYGVILRRRGDGLVIQSSTFTPTPEQKTTLKAHKALLLNLLDDGAGQTPGALVEAVGVFLERAAIMEESGDVPPVTGSGEALQQARRVLRQE